MLVPSTDFVFLITYVALVFALHASDPTDYLPPAEEDDGVRRNNEWTSLRVLELIVSFDIPQSAHECNNNWRFFSAEATITFTVSKTLFSGVRRIRRGGLFILQLQSEGGDAKDFVTLRGVNVSDINFKCESAHCSINFTYGGEIGEYPDVGFVRTSCSEGKRSGDEHVNQMLYNGSLAECDIKFVIGSFNYEAISASDFDQIRVLSTEGSSSRNTDFILDVAHEMIFAMEHAVGSLPVVVDISFLIVPGKNLIKVESSLLLIGTESSSYKSQSILWKLVRETVVMKWFPRSRMKTVEKRAIYGVVAYLIGSLKNEKETDDDGGFASTVLAEQLRNTLPLELNERWSYGVDEIHCNAASPEHAIETIANLVGEKAMNDAVSNFVLDLRRRRKASLLKVLDRVFHQGEQKDWCGRPFNVTDFFTQWNDKPKSGVSITKFLLHVVIVNRRNLAAFTPFDGSKGKADFPPIPVFLKSLEDGNESVIWRSQECGIVFSAGEEYIMKLINNSNIILRVGPPSLLRLTYEESGPLGYPTMISQVYSQKNKVSTNEQLVFVADRLHFLLTQRLPPDYEKVIHLMNVFLKNNDDTAMFILFLPMINRMYRIMAGTHRDQIFTKYVFGLLRMQYLSLWWRDCGDPTKNLHRRTLLPLTVKWNFERAREMAMKLFNESISNGNPLNPNNQPFLELVESVFCAAVMHNTGFPHLFLEAVLNEIGELRGRIYFYDEIIRSLVCTNNETAIAGLVDALFSALEDRSRLRGTTAQQYINILGENPLSINSMLDRLLRNENATRILHEAGLLRAYFSSMTSFCYTYQCLSQHVRRLTDTKLACTPYSGVLIGLYFKEDTYTMAQICACELRDDYWTELLKQC